MTRWHFSGTVLPDGTVRDVWVVDDRISLDPVPDAETVHTGGFLVPGLVDVHCHPGTIAPGRPLDQEQLLADGTALLRAGISSVRVPGSASRLPSWFGEHEDTPRARSAGLPIAVEGGFFEGWGRQVAAAEVPDAAAEEAATAGWCKLIVDWMDEADGYAPTLSAELIAEATRRVHAIGGRVAVHTQSEEGGRSAVAAGVDSIEHGMHLPTDLLGAMAADGIALVPTASAFATLLPQMDTDQIPAAIRRWFTTGLARHPELVRAAYEAGVTVLAGTDLPPGWLTSEIRWLAASGLSAHEALGAASWTARRWLGFAGIEQDALADLVVFAADPRTDLAVLDDPAHVVVRGRLVG